MCQGGGLLFRRAGAGNTRHDVNILEGRLFDELTNVTEMIGLREL